MPIGILTPGFGMGEQWLTPWMFTSPPAFASNALIDATGEKVAWFGRFFHKDLVLTGSTKAIRNICLNFGAVTKAGGSALTLSLQDVKAADGPPGKPDESQDQTVAVANADAGFTSNAWYESGNLSADRTISNGDLITVVAEFDGGGRLGADSVAFRNLSLVGGQLLSDQLFTLLKSGGSWAGLNDHPNIAFKCSDGTYAGLYGCVPVSAINSHTFKQDSSPDEYALCINYPFDFYADGMWFCIGSTFNSGYDVALYQGVTSLFSRTIDPQQKWAGASTVKATLQPFSQYMEFKKNTDYFISLRPNQTTANITVPSIDVAAAGHFDVWPMGQNGQYATRTDLDPAGWSKTSTRRLIGGLMNIAPVDRFWML